MIELSLSLKKIEEEINFAKDNLRKLSNLISGTKKEIKNYEVKLKKYAKQNDPTGEGRVSLKFRRDITQVTVDLS